MGSEAEIEIEEIENEALRHIFRYDYSDGFIDFRPIEVWWSWLHGGELIARRSEVIRWLHKGIEMDPSGAYTGVTIWTPDRGWHYPMVDEEYSVEDKDE